MTFKLDPVRCERKRFHTLLNKGHKFCLVKTGTTNVVMSAREPKILEQFKYFRSDLELKPIDDLLNALPPISSPIC